MIRRPTAAWMTERVNTRPKGILAPKMAASALVDSVFPARQFMWNVLSDRPAKHIHSRREKKWQTIFKKPNLRDFSF